MTKAKEEIQKSLSTEQQTKQNELVSISLMLTTAGLCLSMAKIEVVGTFYLDIIVLSVALCTGVYAAKVNTDNKD